MTNIRPEGGDIMGKGNNPNRSQKSQDKHDIIVKYITNDLVSKGYSVLADHINWPQGSPDEINGYIPDVTASKRNAFLVFETETCPTYKDDHTKEQLTAFNKKGTTYIIVPSVCLRDNKEYDPVPEVKETLRNWDLSSVGVGTCDPFTGKIEYDK